MDHGALWKFDDIITQHNNNVTEQKLKKPLIKIIFKKNKYAYSNYFYK